ncbi:thiamine transporter SLC35F3 [Caerostris darwini]|uniref:Thiamine transporter SLC35F3 n=1 Tax=Caerostris darwini TaxID=1538125 RepID=A0AAV4RTG1_9ARAC|nr:thiamine transporter SLC35F3 [Caerostris darwini]
MSENIELPYVPRLSVDDLNSIEILTADLDNNFSNVCSMLGKDLQEQLDTTEEIIEAINLKIDPHYEIVLMYRNNPRELNLCDDIYTKAWDSCMMWTEIMEKIFKIRDRLQELTGMLNHVISIRDDPQLDHSDLNQVQSNHCCTGRARRTAVGFILAVIMCTTWIGMTHLLKWAYIIHLQPFNCNCTLVNESHSLIIPSTAILEMGPNTSAPKLVTEHSDDKDPDLESFKAPFLMTWFCTACNCLFFPVYLCTRFCSRRTRITARRSIL